jgi:hypothetical protein
MRFLIVVLFIALVAIFFAYPRFMEQSNDECTALAEQLKEVASHDDSGHLIVSQFYGASSSEPSGAVFAKDHYPLLPADLGCALAYWKTAYASAVSAAKTAPAPPAPPPAPASVPEPQPAPQPAPGGIISVVARDITPNGDPISPETVFTQPMNSVAIRVVYPARETRALRFQLTQGRAVISICLAQKAAPGMAWCKFDVPLRKGVYSISFTADQVLLGQFPFAVIGG